LGRSARVVVLSEEDVIQIHQVRTSLESLGARLVAARRPDLSELEQAMADMYSAVQCENARIYCERDLRFHLLLCEKSGNHFLLEHLRRLIVPLFAFIVVRAHAAMDDRERWLKSYEEHGQILKAIRSGDPDHAEREMVRIVQKFSQDTVDLLRKLRD